MKKVKCVRGHISAMSGLLFIFMVALITSLIKYCIFSGLMVRVDTAAALSLESSFASYSTEVFDKYGIFLIRDLNDSSARQKEVFTANMSTASGRLLENELTKFHYIVDDGGKDLYNQISEYMGLEGLLDLGKEMEKELKSSFGEEEIEENSKLAFLSKTFTKTNLEEEAIEEEISQYKENIKDAKASMREGAASKEGLELIERDLDSPISEEDLNKISYQLTNEEKEGANLSVFNKLQKLFMGDISALVLEKGVSDKKISIKDWASNEKEIGSLSKTDSINDLAIREYAFLKFASYTDRLKKVGDNKYIDYELEYLLSGDKNDKDNINSVMQKLFLIREGMNIAYLFTDAEKCAKAEGVAAAIFSFTLNPGIIKAAKYAILAFWASAESVADLKLLYTGKKVPLIKSREDWNISMSSLLKGKFIPEASKGRKGFSYEIYLRGLMLTLPRDKLLARMMDIMETYMIGKNYTSFRMKKALCGQSLKVSWLMPYSNRKYQRCYEYAYVKE